MSYELKVSLAEINLIGRALSDLPFKDVALLIGKLQGQVDAQKIAVDEQVETNT